MIIVQIRVYQHFTFGVPTCGQTILAYDMFIMRITLEQKFH